MVSPLTAPYTPAEKDRILANALGELRDRLPDSAWVATPTPHSALRAECLVLASDPQFMSELAQYLRTRTILTRAVKSFFTHIAMAARAKWDDAPPEMRPVVARGWFLGRWLPTFLVIDGPIGRFFLGEGSPLARRLGRSFPILTAARDFLGEKTFRTLRNSFAHWGFDWEIVGKDSFVVAYDWDKDLPIAKLHQKEADAYHILAFAIIEQVDDVLLSGTAFKDDTT